MSNSSHAKGSALVPARAAIAKAQSLELPKYVDAAEVHRALALLDKKPRVRAFVQGLWVTGARVSELLATRVRDLDFRTKTLSVVTLKRRRPTMRTLPIPPEFVGELAVIVNTAKLGTEDRFFAWSRSRSFELVRDALLAAGVDRRRAHPHVLRHGHAVHALKNGVPLNVLQRALGHSLISSTSVYTTVTGEDVRAFYDKFPW